MVDITQATESTYLAADVVEQSPTKIAVIVDGGNYEDGKFGKRLSMKVNMDTKEKKWNPNMTSAINMKNAWGSDTDTYVGKKVSLTVLIEGTNKKVIAVPMKDVEQKPTTIPEESVV